MYRLHEALKIGILSKSIFSQHKKRGEKEETRKVCGATEVTNAECCVITRTNFPQEAEDDIRSPMPTHPLHPKGNRFLRQT
ncbi:hypothetical protein TNIN_378291 [Trichonephila inaurata madagascariensis]|uniref:Uncharacterized protein n=1 Tax=Trichonephila inaurata madagascariensis TaxID=2747483 RepID=A0A8X6X3U5_9ARAC|nr:hypothetical protein TNIN_378291 [Trichonephila inaurata madagascariensis]